MLSKLFDRFVKESPVTVMTRGLLERLLNPGRLDAWFERTAEKQYTRELLFSTVVDLLMQVVCGVRKSVNVAYQAAEHEIPVSGSRCITSSTGWNRRFRRSWCGSVRRKRAG